MLRDLDANTAQVLRGKVTAISPTSPAIAWEGANCDTSQHLAAWMVQMSGSKGSFSFPVYVDATSASAGTSSLGPYVLVACFRSADLAANDPNRSANGGLIQSFSLALNPFARPTTSGDFRWRSLWTPFTPGTATLNQAGNVEAQSVVVIPTGQIVIFGKKSTAKLKGNRVVRLEITGQVLVQSEPVGPVFVTIRHGSSTTEPRLARRGEDGGRRRLHEVRAADQGATVLPGGGECPAEGPRRRRLPGIVHQHPVHRRHLGRRTHHQRNDDGEALSRE